MQSATPMLSTLVAESAEGCPELVICPFAGASLSAFRGYRTLEGSDLKISLVTYPGRDQRTSEPAVPSIATLARSLALELTKRPPNRRMILLGHSMGAQVAFEACGILESCGRAPSGLVLSGSHAPHLTPRRLLSHLNDDDFLRALLDIGGCSPELTSHSELRELYLPMLRADFFAAERYHRSFEGHVPLETSTLLLYGESDREASRYEVEAWRRWLSGPTQLRGVAGDHFYITQQPSAMIAELRRAFPSLVAPSDPRLGGRRPFHHPY